MKIAYCMSGCIGGLTGKAGDKTDGSERVLNISAESYFKNICCNPNDTIDTFIFSWDTHINNDYKNVYNPKLMLTQDQLTFDIPSKNESGRFQSHYSRWYALKKVVELKNQYESEHGRYDVTILTRLDMYWLKTLNVSLLNPNLVNLDQCIFRGELYGSTKSQELGDRFIASNSENIDKISTIYDYLNEYVNRVQMYRDISSHFIIPHHLKRINLRDKVHFPFMYYTPSYDQKYEDSHCTLVRYRK